MGGQVSYRQARFSRASPELNDISDPSPRPDWSRVDSVLLDMDGTLLDDEKALHADFWPLIEQLRRRGILFSPASGRQYYTLEREFADLADGMVFIAENGSQVLERSGVKAVDELFVSDRDGQPLVVTYGKYPAGMNAKIVVYEKNGADGKRFVGYNSGAVEIVDDARFNEMITASTAPN